ncbi:MAG TPA: SRPBCC family protein [Marmoricola sp.]|nr:SRPBCC family protein [Marmoricola sp.]
MPRRTDTASRTVDAPPDQVYAALVDPEALVAWLPPDGMTARFEHFAAGPGGGYRLVLTYAETSGGTGKTTPDSDVVEARFVELVPGSRVVQDVDFVADDPRHAGTMTMTWELTPMVSGTRVDVRADDVPPGISAEDHAVGLASSLANLAAHLER